MDPLRVNTRRVRFQPGDKLLVRPIHSDPIPAQAIKNIRQTIQKWAGPDVEVLVIDPYLVDLQVLRQGQLVDP